MSKENGVWVGSVAAAAASGRAEAARGRGSGRAPANCARLVFPCRFPAGALAGKKLSLPGDAGSTFRSTLTHCLKGISRQISAAVSEPNAIFSLRFPVRQGNFRPHYGPEAQLIAEVEICPSLHETTRDVERWTAQVHRRLQCLQ